MKEEIISFETAKLAKEKGFDWETYRSSETDMMDQDSVVQILHRFLILKIIDDISNQDIEEYNKRKLKFNLHKGKKQYSKLRTYEKEIIIKYHIR